jgi:hypothetical protein
MKLFSRSPDPLAARTKALSQEIARLEAHIATLAHQPVVSPPKGPPTRSSSSRPEVPNKVGPTPRPRRTPVGIATPPVTSISLRTPPAVPEPAHPNDPHFNDLGVRKYDLLSAWRRLTHHLSGPTSNNPKMVHYLAAGSIQGLRPLRYERRVARNRFLAFLALLLLVLWGLTYWYLKR